MDAYQTFYIPHGIYVYGAPPLSLSWDLSYAKPKNQGGLALDEKEQAFQRVAKSVIDVNLHVAKSKGSNQDVKHTRG